jgi:hypothetical protein
MAPCDFCDLPFGLARSAASTLRCTLRCLRAACLVSDLVAAADLVGIAFSLDLEGQRPRLEKVG